MNNTPWVTVQTECKKCMQIYGGYTVLCIKDITRWWGVEMLSSSGKNMSHKWDCRMSVIFSCYKKIKFISPSYCVKFFLSYKEYVFFSFLEGAVSPIILSSIESAYVLSYPFPSKPSVNVSQLINHSTASLTIFPILIRYYFLVLILGNLINCVTRCKQKQGSGWVGPLQCLIESGWHLLIQDLNGVCHIQMWH